MAGSICFGGTFWLQPTTAEWLHSRYPRSMILFRLVVYVYTLHFVYIHPALKQIMGGHTE